MEEHLSCTSCIRYPTNAILFMIVAFGLIQLHVTLKAFEMLTILSVWFSPGIVLSITLPDILLYSNEKRFVPISGHKRNILLISAIKQRNMSSWFIHGQPVSRDLQSCSFWSIQYTFHFLEIAETFFQMFPRSDDLWRDGDSSSSGLFLYLLLVGRWKFRTVTLKRKRKKSAAYTFQRKMSGTNQLLLATWYFLILSFSLLLLLSCFTAFV